MAKTIGSFEEFKKHLPANWADNYNERAEAVKTYLASGGIIKIGEMKGQWPTLLYPGQQRLEKQIEEEKARLAPLEVQLKEWRKRKGKLHSNKASNVVRKAIDPLYWEHHAKMLTDPSYKKTADLVEPPIHLVHNPKWKKRLKLFVKDKEYRLRLHEARTSIIGKKRDGMAKEEEARMEFTRSLTESESKKLDDKRSVMKRKIEAMYTLLGWSRERR